MEIKTQKDKLNNLATEVWPLGFSKDSMKTSVHPLVSCHLGMHPHSQTHPNP